MHHSATDQFGVVGAGRVLESCQAGVQVFLAPFDQPVGVEQEYTAGGQGEADLGASAAWLDAEWWVGPDLGKNRGTVRGRQQWRQMPGRADRPLLVRRLRA